MTLHEWETQGAQVLQYFVRGLYFILNEMHSYSFLITVKTTSRIWHVLIAFYTSKKTETSQKDKKTKKQTRSFVFVPRSSVTMAILNQLVCLVALTATKKVLNRTSLYFYTLQVTKNNNNGVSLNKTRTLLFKCSDSFVVFFFFCYKTKCSLG